MIKKISREEQQPYGKAGTHCDKRERRQRKMSTQNYLDEVNEEDVEIFVEDEEEDDE